MPELLESSDPRRGDRPVEVSAIPAPPALAKEKREQGRTTPAVAVFERVSKWYGPVIGVNQVTLELRPGITGLVGSNGAGKSTLMRLATGHLRPDLGSVCSQRPRRLERRGQAAHRLTVPTWTPSMKRCRAASSSKPWPGCAAIPRRTPGSAAPRRSGSGRHGRSGRPPLARLLQGHAAAHQAGPGACCTIRSSWSSTNRSAASIRSAGRSRSRCSGELADQGKCLLVSSHELEELEKLTDHVAIMARGRIAAVGTMPRSATCSTNIRCRCASTAASRVSWPAP